MIFSAVRSSIPLRFIPSVYLHTRLENTSPSVQASLAGWRPMHSALRNETPRLRFAPSRSRQSPHSLRRAQFDYALCASSHSRAGALCRLIKKCLFENKFSTDTFINRRTACSLTRTYSRMDATVPDPTVRPPSRIANLRPSSIATGWISSTVIVT